MNHEYFATVIVSVKWSKWSGFEIGFAFTLAELARELAVPVLISLSSPLLNAVAGSFENLGLLY